MKTNLYLLVWLLSASAMASIDFREADALFDAREENLENIAKARRLYQDALKSSDAHDQIYAMTHLGKLAYYEGDLLTDENDHERRVEIFQQCQDDVENINPSKIGKEEPAYYFWKALCIALWGKSASSFSVSGRLGSLEEAMNKGLALDPAYEGGGMHRVMGSVYLKSKALWWIPGLSRFYDPKKALVHIDEAVKIGPQYFVAWLTKAEILKELGRSNEGLLLLQEKRKKLESLAHSNNLPAGLEPESKIVLKQITKALADW